MKNLKITPPDGYEIDKDKSTFENIVFKPIKKELPKSWKELGRLAYGFHVRTDSSIIGGNGEYDTVEYNKNTFATKEQAEASLALAQLSQLREVYRDGWKPDWIDKKSKYAIAFENNYLKGFEICKCSEFLSFQSEEVRDLFLENFRDLIEQAKPLMS